MLVRAVTPYLLKTPYNPDGIEKKTFDDIVENLEKDRPNFLKSFGKMFYGVGLVHHPVSDAVLEFSQSMALTGSPDATIKLVRAWSETDFRGDLAKITIPTLLIHGTGDETVPIENSAHRAKPLLANSELVEYDGAPHGLNVTHAASLNHDLMKFIQHPANTAAL